MLLSKLSSLRWLAEHSTYQWLHNRGAVHKAISENPGGHLPQLNTSINCMSNTWYYLQLVDSTYDCATYVFESSKAHHNSTYRHYFLLHSGPDVFCVSKYCVGWWATQLQYLNDIVQVIGYDIEGDKLTMYFWSGDWKGNRFVLTWDLPPECVVISEPAWKDAHMAPQLVFEALMA